MEFKEALSDILDDRTLYYVVVTYFTFFNMMYINEKGVEERADKVLNDLNISCNLKYSESIYKKIYFYLFPLKLVQKK